jgi:hypothetical protein
VLLVELELRWCLACAAETPHERPEGAGRPECACTACGLAVLVGAGTDPAFATTFAAGAPAELIAANPAA